MCGGTRSRRGVRGAQRGVEPGCLGSVVGVVSLGVVGREVCELLRRYDVDVQAYDPFATAETFDHLGVRAVALDELFATSDVVTLHTPSLPETRKLIDGRLLSSMKSDATLVNTSRGAVVDEPALIEVLRGRPDLFALLDVTDPEPAEEGSPLFTLPNVVLTPHLAGSLGRERRRLGRCVADELARFAHGEPLRWAVSAEASPRLA